MGASQPPSPKYGVDFALQVHLHVPAPDFVDAHLHVAQVPPYDDYGIFERIQPRVRGYHELAKGALQPYLRRGEVRYHPRQLQKLAREYAGAQRLHQLGVGVQNFQHLFHYGVSGNHFYIPPLTSVQNAGRSFHPAAMAAHCVRGRPRA